MQILSPCGRLTSRSAILTYSHHLRDALQKKRENLGEIPKPLFSLYSPFEEVKNQGEVPKGEGEVGHPLGNFPYFFLFFLESIPEIKMKFL